VIVPYSAGDDFPAGGFVGQVVGSVLVDCYALGSVVTPKMHGVGGFAGELYQVGESAPILSNCYSVGSVTGLHTVGGFLGASIGGGTVTACFWDKETSGLTNSAAGTGTNTVAMKTQTTFTGAGWDFDGVWHMTEGVTYPLLSDLSACITATAGANGSIAPSGTVYVALGDSISFTISPEAFYHVADVTTNSVSVGPVLAFTWENVITNGAIHAEFAANEAARGTPEWWLASYGLTNGGLSFDQAEVSATDGDSQPAWKEWIADTNPTNSASWFRILALSNIPPWRVYFPSSTGRVYSLQYNANLGLSDQWSVVAGETNKPGSDGIYWLSDPETTATNRFYRIGVQRP